MTFRTAHPFEVRRDEARRIRNKYPDRIPVIVERHDKTSVQDIDKHKFLVPGDMSVGQFIYVIRKRIKLTPEQAIYIFVNNTLPATSQTMGILYQEQQDEDGFLYILYSGETTFGSSS